MQLRSLEDCKQNKLLLETIVRGENIMISFHSRRKYLERIRKYYRKDKRDAVSDWMSVKYSYEDRYLSTQTSNSGNYYLDIEAK